MRNVPFRLVLLVVAASVGAGCSAPADPEASTNSNTTTTTSESNVPTPSGVTVVVNAQVYTVDPDQAWVESFAYDADGVIVAVGTESDVLAAAGSAPRLVDADGKMVLPGIHDTHVHVPEAGINNDICLLDPDLQLDDYADAIIDCLDSQDDATWVRAAGASLFNLRTTSGDLPIDVLDEIVPDRPAIILDDLGHAAWTNSAGLAAAGITPGAPDPAGGVYVRDKSGRMTGLLLENAQQRVRNAAALDEPTVYDGLLVAMNELARNGITTVSDAGGFWGQNHPAAWQRAFDSGTMTVRAVNSLYLYPDADTATQLAEFTTRFADDNNSLLQFDTVKIYVDGILDLGTAAMIEPYDVPIDPTYPNGFNYFTRDALQHYLNQLHAIGYRAEFHVIGDAAVRTALDAVEAIPASPTEIAGRRHRTTHTYLVHPDDIERFAQIGVIADFQAGPESAATDYHEYLTEFIGDRALDLMPVAELLDTGARATLSSDWDADPLSPFAIMSRAVIRDRNAIDIETAISLMTADAAYALGQDEVTGSISVGKLADYIIVDRNLITTDPNEIDDTTVLLTVLAGQPVYQADTFAS